MNTFGLPVPLSPHRQASNRLLDVMRATTAPVTVVAEVDATKLKALHDRFKPGFETSTKIPLTYTAFFARATALALQANPIMNASLTPMGYIYHPAVNLGVVVRAGNGVLIPVILDAQQKSVPELALAIAANAQRAKAGQIPPGEMAAATFVITNTGRYGTTLFGTPTIMPPNVGMMAFETIQKRPVVTEGDQIVARPMMYISLTGDHRAVDGAEMAKFCGDVKRILEQVTF